MRLISYRDTAPEAMRSVSSPATAGCRPRPWSMADRRRWTALLDAARERPRGASCGRGPGADRREGRPLDEVELLAPVPRPGKVVAIGRNYREHVDEEGADRPPAPLDLQQVAQLGHRRRRRDPLGPGADRPGRLRGRARRGHRADRAPGQRGGRARPRPRLHLLERRLGARPPVRRRPVGRAASRSTRSARWARCSSRPTRSPTRRRSTSPCRVNERIAPTANTADMYFGVADDHQPLLAGVHASSRATSSRRARRRRRHLPRPADPARRRRRGDRRDRGHRSAASTPAATSVPPWQAHERASGAVPRHRRPRLHRRLDGPRPRPRRRAGHRLRRRRRSASAAPDHDRGRAGGRRPSSTGDITDLRRSRRSWTTTASTNVIHLAALQVPFCRADPPRGALVNVVGTVNVFEAVRAACRRPMAPIVYTSSMAMYTADDADPVTGRLTVDAIAHPPNHYGVYKLANEGNARIYWLETGIVERRRAADDRLRRRTRPGDDQRADQGDRRRGARRCRTGVVQRPDDVPVRPGRRAPP